MIQIYKTRIDPLTKEEFIPKRHNQIYKSRETQVANNNLKALRKRSKMHETSHTLEQNRNVLVKLLGSENEIIKSFDFLEGAGFNFKYNTGQGFSDESQMDFFCVYEFKVIGINRNLYKIKKYGS